METFVYVDKPGCVGFREFLPDILKPGHIRIRPTLSLISPGTELHYLLSPPEQTGDFKLGYCVSGVVEEIGPSVSIADIQIGSRVVAMGWQHAVHATLVDVPCRLVTKTPDHVSDEHAVMANLCATALHAFYRGGSYCADDRIVVFGAGLVGQLLAKVIDAFDLDVCLADLNESRLSRNCDPRIRKRSVRSGLDDFHAFSHVFLCFESGVAISLMSYFDILRRNSAGEREGVLVNVGRIACKPLDLSVAIGNIDIRNSARCGDGYRDWDYCSGLKQIPTKPGKRTVDQNLADSMALISDRRLKVDDLVSSKFQFRHAQLAYDLLKADSRQLGILLEYS
jgi:NADPH2:quinone reductase